MKLPFLFVSVVMIQHGTVLSQVNSSDHPLLESDGNTTHRWQSPIPLTGTERQRHYPQSTVATSNGSRPTSTYQPGTRPPIISEDYGFTMDDEAVQRSKDGTFEYDPLRPFSGGCVGCEKDVPADGASIVMTNANLTTASLSDMFHFEFKEDTPVTCRICDISHSQLECRGPFCAADGGGVHYANCSKAGFDGYRYLWSCRWILEENFVVSSYDIVCEPWAKGDTDTIVLGSCRFVYSLSYYAEANYVTWRIVGIQILSLVMFVLYMAFITYMCGCVRVTTYKGTVREERVQHWPPKSQLSSTTSYVQDYPQMRAGSVDSIRPGNNPNVPTMVHYTSSKNQVQFVYPEVNNGRGYIKSQSMN